MKRRKDILIIYFIWLGKEREGEINFLITYFIILRFIFSSLQNCVNIDRKPKFGEEKFYFLLFPWHPLLSKSIIIKIVETLKIS